MPSNPNDPFSIADQNPSVVPPNIGVTAEFTYGTPPIDGDTATQHPNQIPFPEPVPSSVSVPGYEIESVLGRGGMGVV